MSRDFSPLEESHIKTRTADNSMLNIPIKIAGSAQTPALCFAIFSAVETGDKNGRYDSIKEAYNHHKLP